MAGPDELGSDTLSSASPAVEITFAACEAKYVLATPGVNAPNCAGRAERQRQGRRHAAADGAGRLVPYVAGGGPVPAAGRPRAREVGHRVLEAAERCARVETPSRPKPHRSVSSVAMPGPSVKPTDGLEIHAAAFSVPAGCGPAVHGARPVSKPWSPSPRRP